MYLTSAQLFSIQNPVPIAKSKPNFLPLLAVFGATIFIGTSLYFFKSTQSKHTTGSVAYATPSVIPTIVPTSRPVQNYLLASQQSFTQAVAKQKTDPQGTVELVNQAISQASSAITDYPSDFRAWQQRGQIYQSLIQTKPEYLSLAIADYKKASLLNPLSAELTKTLAGLYAKAGDATNTKTYLFQTLNLEPTKAQNFYDLAQIQQQTGDLQNALSTYQRLLNLLTDPEQINQVRSQAQALESLLSQAPRQPQATGEGGTATPPLQLDASEQPSLLRADNLADSVIIAAPSTDTPVTLTNQTTTNALAGEGTLLAGQTDLTIVNEHATSATPIYLTVVKGGKNQVFYLKAKQTGQFTAGLDQAIAEDITFNWWILEN